MNGMGDRTANIAPARGPADIAEVIDLFREYQTWLDEPICFEGFDAELAGLPGAYAAPGGELFLARDADGIAGVIGVVPWSRGEAGDACEIKRLYVRDSWRGRGIGLRLAEMAVSWAGDAGYARVVLDTLEKLASARKLYHALGFEDRPDHYDNPLKSPIFMEMRLR